MGKVRVKAFEICLTEHCNLRCAGCDHASPFLADAFASLEAVEADLGQLARSLHATELKLVGGEPLLHPQVVELARMARRVGISDSLTVVTNGLLLHRAPDELWDLVDMIWISLYPGVKLPMTEAEMSAKAAEHQVLLWPRPTPEFFQAFVEEKLDDELATEVYRRCELPRHQSCHTLHEGYYYKCSAAPFVETRLGFYGIDYPTRQVDGVRVRDNDRLAADLQRYLDCESPLRSCSYCLGSTGLAFPHRQLTREEIKSKRDASVLVELRRNPGTVREMIDWQRFDALGSKRESD